ncbi:beta-galactosidase GalB [Seonamhaeicola maritimus]|uniref:Glycoside hydrolase family 2 protein n=1 Tax=Seonamhaeicola maritimus TaxID=2591822 RepID=A0A5C7GLA0_9FLAO|nr:beta-galactosidase GalB [Seonamhaeicola maritimus]TXG39266.1 glycoside hydrolase family 2 protein [Seonamhaeicola maritimus]
MRFLKLNFILLTFSISILCLSCHTEGASSNPIADSDFNKDWLFQKDSIANAETVNFDDSDWQKVTLPHDWSIDGPFDNKYNARTGGLPVHGIGWYRKHFTIEKGLEGKQISVEFDGAMSNAKVYLNGEYIGERPYGYIGFEIDLTKHINFGSDNVIAVRLAPEDLSMRWYAGAGIYRNVRLKINNSIHIPQWGTYITTPNITNGNADVNIETKLKNTGANRSEVSLSTVIKDANGNIVGETDSNDSLDANSEKAISQIIKISNVTLWDINKSYLYTAHSTLKIGNDIVDEYETPFGVRTIEFNTKDGFLLNGKKVRFNGVCMHHDLGPLGTGVNYRATERQMQIMQSMGVNALRTSHNPPSPEMLEVCDKLGIVVIDEAFDEWKIGKVPNGYHKYFDDWHEKDLRDMIKRDRNHPSVIMWSIGNEILEQGRKDGWKLTKHLNDICHDEDDTRPTTVGFNYYPAPFVNKLANHVDIVGMNYWPTTYSKIVEENPEMIVYGSETSSQTSSRGVYHLPIEFKEKHETNHVSSYDVTVGPPWAYAPDIEFDALEQSSNSLGEFVWTGFDYLGEPTPYGGRDNSTNGYWNDDWPSRSSYFAPVDLCGFPKDRYYLYQSQWTTKPMVHVLPHWNWEGQEGKTIPVYSYTNCEEVELFVNGKSFGKKVKGKDFTEIPSEYHEFEKGMYKTKYRLSWNVPYQPGSIKVVAYKDGKEAAIKEIKTAEKPSKIKLEADRSEISADGKDLSFITISVLDENGNICPKADNLINFKIEGAGTLAAVGNGDQTSLASFRAPERKAFSGKCLLIVKSDESAGAISITASSAGLTQETISILTK